jgi:hypothetical protein
MDEVMVACGVEEEIMLIFDFCGVPSTSLATSMLVQNILF